MYFILFDFLYIFIIRFYYILNSFNDKNYYLTNLINIYSIFFNIN